MYKCTECGCEYDTKPDFCDCGNDEFVITLEEQSKNVKTPDEPKVNIEETVQKFTNNQSQKETVDERNLFYERIVSFFEPVSTIIFCICLILSCLIIAIKPNKTDTEMKAEQKPEVVKSIPSIDKLWNDEKPKVVVKKNEKKEAPIIKIEIPKTAKNTVSKNNLVATPKTSSNTVAKKNKQTVQKVAKVSQPQTVKKENSTPATKITQATVQQAQTTKPVQSVQPVQKDQQTQAIVQPVVVKTEPQKSDVQIKQELMNYKAALRNTIGQRIDFTKVVGDGSCTVSFKVNSLGKLVNRSFTKQSSNITLNDEVYKAVMATPTFKAPPEGYNNETLNLNIKFYNGNFEISLQ